MSAEEPLALPHHQQSQHEVLFGQAQLSRSGTNYNCLSFLFLFCCWCFFIGLWFLVDVIHMFGSLRMFSLVHPWIHPNFKTKLQIAGAIAL